MTFLSIESWEWIISDEKQLQLSISYINPGNIEGILRNCLIFTFEHIVNYDRIEIFKKKYDI